MPEPKAVRLSQAATAPNEYWDTVKPYLVLPDPDPMKRMVYGSTPTIGSLLDRDIANMTHMFQLRDQLVRQYAWSIPDPDSLRFIAEHSRGYLIDPMAGTGYWCYLLSWLGVNCRPYDLDPPREDYDGNFWHPNTRSFVHITAADVTESASGWPDATLFLSWPPMTDAAARALAAYQGSRVIYIGEGMGGATGDDTFHEMLDAKWNRVDKHPIVQWVGLHDTITVWDRR